MADQIIVKEIDDASASASEEKKAPSFTIVPASRPSDLDGESGKQRTRWERFSSQADRLWIWEFIGIIGSALCIGGLIGLLVYLDGRETPSWTYVPWHYGETWKGRNVPYWVTDMKITLSISFLVSWFSTFAKILLLIPITKGLGQLKWVWFQEQERSLVDFETYESASRGVLGSALLIWKFKARHFAVIGAIAIIVSLGFDPTVQALVQTIQELSPQKEDAKKTDPNYVPKPWVGTNTLWKGVETDHNRASSLDMTTRARIISAILDTGSENPDKDLPPTWMVPLYSCVTNNCDWDLVANVAVYTRCADLTSKLRVNCTYDATSGDTDSHNPGCDVTLPNNLTLGRNKLATISTTDRSGFKPIVFANYTAPLAIVQSIGVHADNITNWIRVNASTPLVATECAVVPAVQVIQSQISTFDYTPDTGKKNNKQPVTKAYWADALYDNFDKAIPQGDGSLSLTVEWSKNANLSDDSWVPKNESKWTEPQHYIMTKDGFTALKDYFNTILSGTYSKQNGTAVFESNYGVDDIIQGIYGNPFSCTMYVWAPDTYSDGTNSTTFNDAAACSVQNMASAASVAIRSSPVIQFISDQVANTNVGSASNVSLLDHPDLAVSGHINRYVSMIYVSWFWILFPVTLWILTTIFFVGVMIKTKKIGANRWRTSPLAVVFLDIGDQERDAVRGHKLTESGLSRRAEGLKLKLRMDEGRGAMLTRPEDS